MKAEIREWILSIKDRPNVKAVNIGLFESPDGYKAYLIGSNTFDAVDDDWACNEDYSPKQKYLILPNTAEKDWLSVQNAVISAIKDVLILQDSILSYVPTVTVGFDDGNLVRVK